MSFACPDGHTSRFASIESESSAGHTAFSSMSVSLTVVPCFSRMTFATAAFAAEPSHGFTASVIEPVNVFASAAFVVVSDVPFLSLPHAASASARTIVSPRSRLLRFIYVSI